MFRFPNHPENDRQIPRNPERFRVSWQPRPAPASWVSEFAGIRTPGAKTATISISFLRLIQVLARVCFVFLSLLSTSSISFRINPGSAPRLVASARAAPSRAR